MQSAIDRGLAKRSGTTAGGSFRPSSPHENIFLPFRNCLQELLSPAAGQKLRALTVDVGSASARRQLQWASTASFMPAHDARRTLNRPRKLASRHARTVEEIRQQPKHPKEHRRQYEYTHCFTTDLHRGVTPLWFRISQHKKTQCGVCAMLFANKNLPSLMGNK